MKPTILTYSEKSFIVIGDSRPYKDQFKIDGKFVGKFNRFLKVKNPQTNELENTTGWVFSNRHLEYIQKVLNTEIQPNQTTAEENREFFNLEYIHKPIDQEPEQQNLF